MATDTRDPTSDATVSGSWSGSDGTRYTLVDDYPDTVPNDVLTAINNGSYILFEYTDFAVPAGSTDITVQVRYYARNDDSADSSSRSRLNVGGTLYVFGTSHTVRGTTPALWTDDWTTNPKSTVAWTVDDVNGVGTNNLRTFGFEAPDATPDVDFSCVQLQVTYTPPAGGGEDSAAYSILSIIPGRS